MGDHVPAFLMREFRIDLGLDSDEATDAAEPAEAPALETVNQPSRPEVEAAASATVSVEAAKPKAPRRRGAGARRADRGRIRGRRGVVVRSVVG